MSRFAIKVDTKEMGQWLNKINELNGIQKEAFFDTTMKDITGRLLALVIPRTPVGKSTKFKVKGNDGTYSSQSTHGGTLRKGWSIDNCTFESTAGRHTVNIINPTYYASYVEYGHRQTPGRFVPAIGKRLKRNWVQGQFFLQKSEEALKPVIPTVVNMRLTEYLKKAF